jgi:hypothetical protein
MDSVSTVERGFYEQSKKLEFSIISVCCVVGCLKFNFSSNRLELPPEAFRVDAFGEK